MHVVDIHSRKFTSLAMEISFFFSFSLLFFFFFSILHFLTLLRLRVKVDICSDFAFAD